ncbi:MAG: T9SS type A sorting domain-containing protein [Bacteroidales bacterium]|nr:T9SS type A sorting domain-containing protein [Bacteroidales bacterium]
MKTKLYKIFLFLTLLLFSKAAFGQTFLLWVGDVTADCDIALMNYLSFEGWVITNVDASTFKSSYVTADKYADYDAVYISEIVGSGDAVAYATAGFPIPCVTTEGYAVRSDKWAFITNNDTEFHQSGSGERTDGVKTLIINNAEHYITSAYEEYAEVAWTTAEINNLGVTGCKLDQTMEGVIKLATFQDAVMADFPTLWAIPAGSVVTGSSTTIPVNIVVFGAINPGMGTFATNDFNNIIHKSLEWAAGNVNAIKNPIDLTKNYLNILPNPAKGIVNVSFALDAPGKVRLNIYDITGKIIETLESGYLDAGPNTIKLDFTDKSGAQYIINIITGNSVLTGKICKN